MASTPNDLVIRPVCLQDAHALWTIAREQGVIETTLALPSLRLEQERTISMAKAWFITGTSTGLGRTLAEEAVLPIMREQRSGILCKSLLLADNAALPA